MKIVDLSHTMSIHTPGWVGYAGNKMYYAQNLQTVGIVAQRVETSMHSGTHFDGAMHATDGRTGDMASLPLDYLVSHGVVVDLAPQVSDWSAITPEMIEKSGAEIRDGDILILHTGWHKYYEGQSKQDLVRYFCDHPMNTSIRTMRPDIAHEFEKTMGKAPTDYFGTFEYVHKRSGRKVRQDVFPFHHYAFQEGLMYAENLGGDLESVLGKRCIIGAFPWRYEGLEACPCRVLAIFDAGDAPVEALGNAARGILGRSE